MTMPGPHNPAHVAIYLGDFPAWRGNCLRCTDNIELRAAWIVCGEIFTLGLCQECRDIAPEELRLPAYFLAAPEEVFSHQDRRCLEVLPGATTSARSMGIDHRSLGRCMGWGLILRTENDAYRNDRQRRTQQFCYALTDRGRAALDGTLAAESVPRVQAQT